MSIRKESIWDKNSGRFVGHVYYGGQMKESRQWSPYFYGSWFQWQTENASCILLFQSHSCWCAIKFSTGLHSATVWY